MGEVISDVLLYTIASLLVAFALVGIATAVALIVSIFKHLGKARDVLEDAENTHAKYRGPHDDRIIRTAEEALNGDQDGSPNSGEIRH